jgi:hypothetical protein
MSDPVCPRGERGEKGERGLKSDCVRAGFPMTKQQWFALPLELRQRYWKDTDWGKKPASEAMVEEIAAALAKES